MKLLGRIQNVKLLWQITLCLVMLHAALTIYIKAQKANKLEAYLPGVYQREWKQEELQFILGEIDASYTLNADGTVEMENDYGTIITGTWDVTDVYLPWVHGPNVKITLGSEEKKTMYFYKTGKGKTLRFPREEWVIKLDEDDGSRYSP